MSSRALKKQAWRLESTTRDVYEFCPMLRNSGLSSTQSVAAFMFILHSPTPEHLFAAFDSFLRVLPRAATCRDVEGFLASADLLFPVDRPQRAKRQSNALKRDRLIQLGWRPWTPARTVKEPRRERWLDPVINAQIARDPGKVLNLQEVYSLSYSLVSAWKRVLKEADQAERDANVEATRP